MGKSTAKSDAKTSVFKMNTDLGQHILKNPKIAEAIVDKAGIKPSDTVLEVGPGTGNLTIRILEQAKKTIAAEMDPRMAAELTKRVQGKPIERKLEIMLGDVIKGELPYHDICISNTPYQISSPLIFKLLNMPKPPRVSVLMFQREFALRLLAKPGDPLYCRLTVNAQMWANITHVMKVGRGNFKPPPNVESSVVKMEIKDPRPQLDYNEWDGLLRVCFNRKNRTLSASFKTSAILEILVQNYKTYVSQRNGVFNTKGYDESVANDDFNEVVKQKINYVLLKTKMAEMRAQKCDQVDFLRLLFAFNKVGIHFT